MMGRVNYSLVFGALALLILGFVLDRYYLGVATEMLIAVLFAISYNIVLGYGGMISFGHSLFFGVGAYTSAILLRDTGLPYVATIFVAIAFNALLGAVLGVLTWRTKTHYFAMVTLAMSQLGFAIVYQWYSFTNGDNGIFGYRMDSFLSSVQNFYWFSVIVVVLALFILYRILESPYGLALRAVRDSEHRSRFLGLKPEVIRLVALTISGAGTGLAGSLYAGFSNMVYPDLLHWSWAARPLIMTILGGLNTFLGPGLGAIILTGMEVWFGQGFKQWMLLIGLVVTIIGLTAPEGIAGYVTALRRRLQGVRGDTGARRAESQ